MSILYTVNSLRARDLFSLALRVFKTKPLRMALTILGMGVGVGVVLFLVSFGYGLQFILLGNIASTEDAMITVEAYYPGESGLKIDSAIISKISSLPEVSEISPVSEMTAEVHSEKSSGYVISKIVDDKYYRLSGVSKEGFDTKANDTKGAVVSKSTLLVLGITKEEMIRLPVLSADLMVPIVSASGVDTDEVSIYPVKKLAIGGFISDEGEVPLIIIPSSFVNLTTMRSLVSN